MLGLLLGIVFVPLLVTRVYFLVARLRQRWAGAAAQLKCSYCEADRDEEEVYSGRAAGCPAYDKVPLPRTGGTVHVPRRRADSGVAILCVPGKGRVFNLFPLQKMLQDQGVAVDIIGVDYCGYGAGFERSLRQRWLPPLLYEMRLGAMSEAVVEALEITSGIFRKVLVVANSTAASALLELLSSEAAERLPASVRGVWVTNPAIVFKEGHFVNSIVDSPLPMCFFALLDRVVGLGPAEVMSDENKDWFYFTGGEQQKYKECFAMKGHASGVMVGVPRYQQHRNPMRFMHAAEVVRLVRSWATGVFKRHRASPPVFFSLNYGEDEWHCNAKQAKKMLAAWGATEVGPIETHEEWLFETVEQWEKVLSVLKAVVRQALEADWK